MSVRLIEVRESVMARNNEIAATVRERLEAAGVLSLNLVSSPGAGKTALLECTLDALGDEMSIAVITGDVQTQNDADRLARHTSSLVQAVVTGGACHLDARQIERALEAIDLASTDLLLIENVGNLVCPAAWDLGEHAKVVLFSVTEGEDKPVKYPRMFREARHVVMTKVDLLAHLSFDLTRAIGYAREVNPGLDFLLTSARTGWGMNEWFELLRSQVSAMSARAEAVPV